MKKLRKHVYLLILNKVNVIWCIVTSVECIVQINSQNSTFQIEIGLNCH